MKMLCIAEKPSVAMSIAKVLGVTSKGDGYVESDDYVISWCVGHLIELAEPGAYDEKYDKWRKSDLPIIPFKGNNDWKYQVSSSTKKQFNVLRDLMKRDDIDCICNCCDAGKEGELIFRLVYDYCHCKKKMKRLWISSMEDEAIIKGFENLKDGSEYDSLYEAALCRERADWILGINATRLFSCLYGQTLNVGRVMTPTLAMAVEREANIRAFKPEDFYTVVIQTEGIALSSERISDKSEAENLLSKCQSAGTIKITKAEKNEKREKAPALFDLTTLQREANKKLGYTAQQTLDYTQSLYEKKLCSYPRTDSRYLTDDMEATVDKILGEIWVAYNYTFPVVENISQVINNKKVSDHHAIIPTVQIGKCNLEELPKGEQEILRLISERLVEGVSDPCKYLETVIEAECCDAVFKAKGKQITDPGWKIVSKITDDTAEDDGTNTDISVNVRAGDSVEIKNCSIKEGKTSSPKSFTEDTLLSAMEKAGADETPDEAERKGLGTPATRAGIIEKLVRIGFIERKGDKKTKYLVPTHKGEALITVVPEAIQSASMTAEWEQKLLEIERRNFDAEEFMEEITALVSNLIDTYEIIPDAEVLMKPVYEPVGKCPCCGLDVVEKSKGFGCSNKDCKFILWKDNRFFDSLSKKITKSVAEQLLKNGKVKLKKCRSVKTGKTYDCTVVLSTNENSQAVFTLDFTKGK